LWQTPVADDAVDRAKGKYNSRGEPKLSAQVKLFPTMTVSTGAQTKENPTPGQTGGTSLLGYVRMFPTPCARDYRNGMSQEALERRQKESSRGVNLSEHLQRTDGGNGQLNPAFVEWLMGYPEGWTDLEG
jgi:hypothetical protein